MPRYARQILPGTVTHIISRFADRRPRLAGARERKMYLTLAQRAVRRFDWAMLAFALMSTHTHLASEMGSDPLWRFAKRLHSPLARWLNKQTGGLGPVLADRPKQIYFEPEAVSSLIAYIHNNPVRAGLVDDPAESDWTSHRAYIGLDEPPPWIDVELGLSLCGFSADSRGRQAFHDFVVSRSGNGREPLLCGDGASVRRAELRRRLVAPVESTSARLVEASSSLVQSPVVRSGTPARRRWEGDIFVIVETAAEHCGLTVEELRSRSKRRAIVRGRRVAIIAAHEHLGRTIVEVTAALGISGAAGSQLLDPASERVSEARAVAVQVAKQIRRLEGTKGNENDDVNDEWQSSGDGVPPGN